MRTLDLDHNATTPLHPEVLREMLPYFSAGNPSSTHAAGREARVALDRARERIARALVGRESEVVFTSGGTEANNLAVLGAARSARAQGSHVVTTAIEHASVLEPFDRLRAEGFEVETLPVEPDGRLAAARALRALRPDTILLSVMAANNETGALQPVDEIARDLPPHVLFHCDATQAIGKVPLGEWARRAHLLTISGHKIYGPKGAGALLVRRPARPEPLFFGGGQESGLRPGTENVPALVGLSFAVERALARTPEYGERVGALAQRLFEILETETPGVRLHGPRERDRRLPNTLNLSFPAFDGRALLIALDLAGVCASAGSACASGATAPSHVLLSTGLSREEAVRSVRFSLGWGLAESDVDEAAARILRALREIEARRP